MAGNKRGMSWMSLGCEDSSLSEARALSGMVKTSAKPQVMSNRRVRMTVNSQTCAKSDEEPKSGSRSI